MNILDVRDGKRHDMWIPLECIKMGRLHLAITVVESAKQVLYECPVFLLLRGLTDSSLKMVYEIIFSPKKHTNVIYNCVFPTPFYSCSVIMKT